MSNICLQFGQCGNQLGSQLFNTLYNDNKVDDKWFKTKKDCRSEANAILIDTEDKVVHEIVSKKSPWLYHRKNIVLSGSGGSGNNWALGYFINGPNAEEKILERIQRLMECSDKTMSFLALMSSAGGTGTGVGSYICKIIKENFPKVPLIGIPVLPFNYGEVTVQNYNIVFLLSKLYESCDSVWTFSNDYISKITSNLKIKEPSFKDYNQIISAQLSCVLSSSNDYGSHLKHISSPDFKFLTSKATPFVPDSSLEFESPYKWDSLLKHIKMMYVSEDGYYDFKPLSKLNDSKSRKYKYNKSIANLIACSGADYGKALLLAKTQFNVDELYFDIMQQRFYVTGSGHKIQKRNKFCTIVSNNGLIVSQLDSIVEKAWKCFAHDAYTHHYYNHGAVSEDFIRAFQRMENIIHHYNTLK